METKFVKIAVFVPTSHADKVREALNEGGAGCWNKYDNCSFSVKGTGRFRPLEGADPAIGQNGKINEVEEERIESICLSENLEKTLGLVKGVHPYEEPAIDVYPLLND
jgi:hypothetical protein